MGNLQEISFYLHHPVITDYVGTFSAMSHLLFMRGLFTKLNGENYLILSRWCHSIIKYTQWENTRTQFIRNERTTPCFVTGRIYSKNNLNQVVLTYFYLNLHLRDPSSLYCVMLNLKQYCLKRKSDKLIFVFLYSKLSALVMCLLYSVVTRPSGNWKEVGSNSS